ncbi:serine O-acetyltransferase [Tessaracoccus bendigoensis DSM 12906]|uniref:Serine acetyltransferase n=2 Tax=Tessaracoccus TaxID=72763 RepID=A0A1M6MV69_9ACTN|nr:serine O-acetyltransferase [Tessaracoccus bendigoensis DSM 12906]
MGKSRGVIASDKARGMAAMLAPNPPFRARLNYLLFNSEFHCVVVYRLGRYARLLREHRPAAGLVLTFAHRVINRFVTHLDHVDISPQADIGPGLLLMHRHGVLIGPVIVGRNCVIHQNVTIGQRVAGGDRGLPTIGDNVWIGPAAVITGSVNIGDGVTISAGSVLSKDVPDRCLVAGNPARVIVKDYDNAPMIGVQPD